MCKTKHFFIKKFAYLDKNYFLCIDFLTHAFWLCVVLFILPQAGMTKSLKDLLLTILNFKKTYNHVRN